MCAHHSTSEEFAYTDFEKNFFFISSNIKLSNSSPSTSLIGWETKQSLFQFEITPSGKHNLYFDFIVFKNLVSCLMA